TTAEMYLIRAESNLRIGQPEPALSDLNLLRKHRCKPTDFYQLEITATPGLLDTIIAERKRELVRRGLRWMDLRRLNQDPSTAETLARTMNGQVFNLQPNSKRYTFPIPDYIIDATGMEQNER
ncbi:MAG TPA: RagB/SusD family nutrient uptake outer membrane protein, partial [Parapedobacter sp.]|nr:RagB/SusD family nutrient uptake outer membrane protein [Parapedobacter sp.]